MNILWVSILVVLAIASYVVSIIYLTKRYLIITLVLLTIFWVIVLVFGFGWVYFWNPTLSRYIDTYIRPDDAHLTIEGKHAPLPLPPATALKERSTHEKATYYSRLSVGEVTEFYKQKTLDIKIKTSESEDQGILLLLEYQGAEYSVLVTPTGKSASHILVESIPEDK